MNSRINSYIIVGIMIFVLNNCGGSFPTIVPPGIMISTITFAPTNTLLEIPIETRFEDASITQGITLTPTEIKAITATHINYHIPGNSFTDINCSISMEYPLKWIIEKTNNSRFEDNPCVYGLKPENYEQIVSQSDYCMGDYALYIVVLNIGFEDAAAQLSFVFEDGNWYTSGRQGARLPAEIIQDKGRYILRGEYYTGIYGKDCSGYLAIDTVDGAVINNGGKKSIGIIEGSSEYYLHFEYILQTLSIIQ
jgi:hypothetical protein